MRKKLVVFLIVFLCVFLLSFGAGYLNQQIKAIEQERTRLEIEILLLETENAHLRDLINELRGQQAELSRRMQKWLDTWEVDIFQSTAYTLECGYPWDDGFTYLETKAIKDYTIAVDPGIIPLGSDVYVVGIGWRKADDIGTAIKGYMIDFYMGSGLEAKTLAMHWGRKTVKVVYQRCRESVND